MRTPIGSRHAQQFNGNDLAQELVPLGFATRTISMKVYGQNASASQLIGIAHTVAALAPLYTHNSDGTDIRPLTDEELLSGFFRRAGAELHFRNGSPPIANIAVTHQAIELVVGILASTVDEQGRHSVS
jgi:hypothetical protein